MDFESKELKELRKSITDEWGVPVFKNEGGSISGINRSFFAELFKEIINPVYDAGEEKFYIYSDDNGLLESQTDTQMTCLINRLFTKYCKQCEDENAIGKCSGSLIGDIKRIFAGLSEKKDFFKSPQGTFIHCGNRVLVYDKIGTKWNLRPFSKEFRSRNRTEFIFDPDAQCLQFLEKLIRPAMSKEDAELLQLYIGQCLLGYNYSQIFLMMTGTPGGGKSTGVNVFESIIGRFNVTELRLAHMHSRFELQRLIGKTLLTAKDVKSNFLNTTGANTLKALVGNDVMTTERKLKNNVSEINGNFNVIVTANNNLRITLDGDLEAWRRRLLWIKYDNPPPEEVIIDFDKKLLDTEESGILNWALEGTVKLLKNGGKIPRSNEQKRRINDLLEESDSINIFVKECVKSTSGQTAVTGHELLMVFAKYCKSRNWDILPERAFQKGLRTAMLKIHNTDKRNDIQRKGKPQRGYSGVQLIPQ